jgi:hypothetical protein
MIGGPADLVIEYDDDAGVLQDITEHVLSFNGITKEQLTEEVRAFGSAWDRNITIGVGKGDPIELGGLFDDVANGPDDLFGNRTFPEGPSAATRTIKITWFGSKTTEWETILQKYGRNPNKNEAHKYATTLLTTGAPTET